MVKSRKQFLLLTLLIVVLLLCLLFLFKTNYGFAPENQQKTLLMPSQQNRSKADAPVLPSQENPQNRCLSLDCGNH